MLDNGLFAWIVIAGEIKCGVCLVVMGAATRHGINGLKFFRREIWVLEAVTYADPEGTDLAPIHDLAGLTQTLRGFSSVGSAS